MADILIVDDQPCVRELLSEELILEGYQVHGLGDLEPQQRCLEFCPSSRQPYSPLAETGGPEPVGDPALVVVAVAAELIS